MQLHRAGIFVLIMMLGVGVYIFGMGMHSVDTAFNLESLDLAGDYVAFTGELQDPTQIYRGGFEKLLIGFVMTLVSLSFLGIVKWGQV